MFHTQLWQHQKHLLHVAAGEAERVVEALGSWQVSADKVPADQRGDPYITLLRGSISMLF